jgi:N-acyl homoserine lactone hydrolase
VIGDKQPAVLIELIPGAVEQVPASEQDTVLTRIVKLSSDQGHSMRIAPTRRQPICKGGEMSVSIELLECGSLAAPLSSFEDGAADGQVTLPVPAWLIRHPKGIVLLDTGMHTELSRPSGLLDAISAHFDVGLQPEQLVSERLRSTGVEPSDVDFVVLSHLHFDHSGGLAQIPDARVIVQKSEWAAGFDDDLSAANSFNPKDYDLGHEVVLADGEHDVLGDGLVTCIPTPGHTTGHQSLRVRLETDEIVFCCDCAYFSRTLDGGVLPPFGYDVEQQAESIRRLVAMRNTGARLIPGHDSTTFAALPTRLT